MSVETASIWPPHETFYLQSMLFNTNSALESVERITDVIATIDGLPEDEIRATIDPPTLLDELQNVVLQAGALSRYFWPVRKKPHSVRRGEQLRRSFAMSESSPLYSRHLRNALEHFDERLDDYLHGGIVGVILPEYVGMRPADETVPFHLFRAYYLDVGVFSLLGEEFSIPPVVDELGRVHERLIFLSTHGGRLRDLVNNTDVSDAAAETPNDR
jgi:hypothetical protein